MVRKLQSPKRSPGLKSQGFKTLNKSGFSSPKSSRKVSFSELEKENKVLLAEQLSDRSLIQFNVQGNANENQNQSLRNIIRRSSLPV